MCLVAMSLAACMPTVGGSGGSDDSQDVARDNVRGRDSAPLEDTTPDGDAPSTEDIADEITQDMGESFACPRVTSRIQENHDHLLVVPDEDLRAGAEVTYETVGASPHIHLVTITEELFALLALAEIVTAELMDAEGHTHSVEVRCAPPE
jgi:hypothetical protein